MSHPTQAQPHAEFMSHCNQKGFQRLYLEYYAYIHDLDARAIKDLYCQGLRYNLQKAHFNAENLLHVKDELNSISKLVQLHVDALKQALEAEHTDASRKLQKQLIRVVDSSQNDELEAVSALEGELLSHLRQHPGDLIATFDLGWLYFHMLSDTEAATMLFSQVVDDGMSNDHPLAELALRYLAMCKHIAGNDAEAVSLLKRASSLDQHDRLYYMYEMAQYMINTASSDVAISHMKTMIKNSPLYFLHIESDPFFMNNPETDTLLTRFHNAKLETIREVTLEKWYNSKLMEQPLPAEFDHQEIFESTFQEHRALLMHQPYPVLCKVEQISTKLMKNLTSKAHYQLKSMDRQLTEHMKHEQYKWKIVNVSGVVLVYIAVLLTLASIFLFIGGDMLGITTPQQSIDWGRLVPKIFAAVVATGVVGILLLQFNPPRLKELARKKSMLTTALGNR